MRHSLIAAAMVLLSACGGGGSGPVTQGPPSAKSVALNSSDFSGEQLCPESGTYENYLTMEQTKAPARYTTDKKTFDDLKAGGLNDSYLAVYADTTSSCGQFATTTTGKVARVYAFRFKDSASAGAAYTNQGTQFRLSDSQIATLKAAGGTVGLGATTGLGANSIVVTFSGAGVSLYVAEWQNKEFVLALLIFDLPINSGTTIASKINGRVR
ncbi:MAG TPA: hypothetical protein VGX27_11020 [Candidatus Dormibacteraeota bacterium]|nr:hypothetical protein [Candidatus Dormibacteraeota bacterium]